MNLLYKFASLVVYDSTITFSNSLYLPSQVQFREIPSHVLCKVCMYFAYKNRYTNSTSEIPEFPIEPEIALELLMAANFLDC